MLLLGIDLGTSSVKVSVVESELQKTIVSVSYPETESPIISRKKGWAEQSPDQWWSDACQAIIKANAAGKYDPKDIEAIGIAYQMHGLVVVDKHQNILRDSIIWCDSRAVEIGEQAFREIGEQQCQSCMLNSPGNFTASKLAWVKQNEPGTYEKIDKLMLPGDFIAMKLTGEITTTSSALSEGVLWDFKKDQLSRAVMDHFGFDNAFIPCLRPLFSEHGKLIKQIAAELGLKEGISISYKAGDQLNNALSLKAFKPGEVAATAGTSGVIYAVTDHLFKDAFSRVNSFVHVNHTNENKRLGVLLCINGVGIMNRWIRQLCGDKLSYDQMNKDAGTVRPGSEGLVLLPFGNGAERMLQNKIINAHIHNIDLNLHSVAHVARAVQEGIAFAFRYGLDIMRENGLYPAIIRAGRANMFLSNVFVRSFVNATGVPVELYDNDGSVGAALGAGIGAGIYKTNEEAFSHFKPVEKVEATDTELYNQLYESWKYQLNKQLK